MNKKQPVTLSCTFNPHTLSSDFPLVRINLSILSQPLILYCRAWQLFSLSVFGVQIWLVLSGHLRGCFPARTTQIIHAVCNNSISFIASVIYTFILSNGIIIPQKILITLCWHGAIILSNYKTHLNDRHQ